MKAYTQANNKYLEPVVSYFALDFSVLHSFILSDRIELLYSDSDFVTYTNAHNCCMHSKYLLCFIWLLSSLSFYYYYQHSDGIAFHAFLFLLFSVSLFVWFLSHVGFGLCVNVTRNVQSNFLNATHHFPLADSITAWPLFSVQLFGFARFYSLSIYSASARHQFYPPHKYTLRIQFSPFLYIHRKYNQLHWHSRCKCKWIAFIAHID